MKKFSFLIAGILVAGTAILSTGCNNNGKSGANSATSATSGSTQVSGNGKLAYVDIDSLEEHYDVMKVKKEEFKKRQEAMDNELQRSYQSMQNDAAEVQKKAQANTLSQPEYEAAQKRLMQAQQSLETRKQALTDQLMKDSEEFNKGLKSRLDSFLNEYNKTHNYDFIFSYSAGGGSSILYANKALNITDDVIKGMNTIAKSDADKKK